MGRTWTRAQTTKRARTRRDHPGVQLISPREGRGWRAVYTDPDTGQQKWPDLKALHGITDARGAVEWAKDKSAVLRIRLRDIKAGAPRGRGEPIRGALDRYLKVKASERKPSPKVNPDHYERRLARWTRAKSEAPQGFERFLDWADDRGLKNTAAITGADLARFSDDVGSMRRTAPVKGGDRGEWAESSEPLSPRTRKALVIRLRGFLRWCALNELLSPHLTSDRIVGALKVPKVISEEPTILGRVEVRDLVQAAVRHDRKHGGPAGPLVLVALLTGLRKSEEAWLDWSSITGLDDETDDGAIKLLGYTSKTGRGRTVSFDVCPAVKSLLAALWLRAGRPRTGRVFPSEPSIDAVRDRLVDTYGVPPFLWKALRSTGESFLTKAPGCRRSLTAVAERYGHATAVSEAHYQAPVSVAKPDEDPHPVRKIPHDAATLEAAFGIVDLAGEIVEMVGRKAHDAERRSHPKKRSIASR